MSKRHRWGKFRWHSGPYWVCLECRLRRRIKKRYQVVNCWEYLPANVSGWEHAQRTCGPCPGGQKR